MKVTDADSRKPLVRFRGHSRLLCSGFGHTHGTSPLFKNGALRVGSRSSTETDRPRVARILAGLAIATAVLGCFGCSPRSRDESDVAAMYRAGRIKESQGRVDVWLRFAPTSADAHLWKARLALTLRQGDEAAEALERARQLGSPRDTVDRLRAIATAFNGDFGAAEPKLRQAFNEQVNDPLVDEALSRIYLETYDMPRAKVALKRWALDAPADSKPYLWRAELDVRTGDSAVAIADYREALARDPDSAAAQLGLAKELHKAHRGPEAVEAFNAYLKLKPDDPAGLIGAGRIAVESGDLDVATTHLEKALRLAPDDAGVHRALADLFLRQGQTEAALTHLDRAVKLDPYELETRHSRSRVFSILGRADEARAEQAETAKLRAEQTTMLSAQSRLVTAPNDVAAKLVIARWLFAHGKEAEGVRWAEAIIRDRPGPTDASQMLVDYYTRAGNPGLANFYRTEAAADIPARLDR